MKKSPTQSRKRVKRRDFIPFHSPLGFPQLTRGSSLKKAQTQAREWVTGGTPWLGAGAAPLLESSGKAAGYCPSSVRSTVPT